MSVSEKTCSADKLQQALQSKDPYHTYEVSSSGGIDSVVVNGGANIIYVYSDTNSLDGILSVDRYLDRLHSVESSNTHLIIVIVMVIALAVVLILA